MFAIIDDRQSQEPIVQEHPHPLGDSFGLLDDDRLGGHDGAAGMIVLAGHRVSAERWMRLAASPVLFVIPGLPAPQCER
jgi:hypothetical protein